jgi:S1-C subfamily serine protease
LTGCQSIADWKNIAGPIPPNASELFSGTGIFVTNSILLTAKHVVDDCTEVRVTSASGAVLGAHATVLARSGIDLALIQIMEPAVSIRPARFHVLWPSAEQMATLTDRELSLILDNAGPILALGYPTERRTVDPIVRRIDGLAASRPERAQGYHLYIVLGQVEHGDSGGALVDQEGSVVGMMTNTADLYKLEAQMPSTKSIAQIQHGFGVGFASTDLLAFIVKAGVSLADTPREFHETAVIRITQSLARVFCFR